MDGFDAAEVSADDGEAADTAGGDAAVEKEAGGKPGETPSCCGAVLGEMTRSSDLSTMGMERGEGRATGLRICLSMVPYEEEDEEVG